MSQRYTITEKEPFSDTRVFNVLSKAELDRPWTGRDVWVHQIGTRWVCRCTGCSSPSVAMLSSCSHARAVNRHLTPASEARKEASPREPQGTRPGELPWYEGYLEGLIRLNAETPADLITTCETWKKADLSVLQKFAVGESVRPAELAAEALEQLTLHCPGTEDPGHADLRHLAEWAQGQHKVCEAAMGLQAAAVRFREVAVAQELSFHDRLQLRLLALN